MINSMKSRLTLPTPTARSISKIGRQQRSLLRMSKGSCFAGGRLLWDGELGTLLKLSISWVNFVGCRAGKLGGHKWNVHWVGRLVCFG
ncbi:hypothetical protein DI395_46405 [Bradyrhizobium diazoefficiens]|nr:hypothetical protein DI395_46405 [Bradyrhizobium diazoefficiens]